MQMHAYTYIQHTNTHNTYNNDNTIIKKEAISQERY